MVDSVEEFAVQQSKECVEKRLEPTTKDVFNLGDENEERKLQELMAEIEPLMKMTKEVPGTCAS